MPSCGQTFTAGPKQAKHLSSRIKMTADLKKKKVQLFNMKEYHVSWANLLICNLTVTFFSIRRRLDNRYLHYTLQQSGDWWVCYYTVI